MKSAPAPIRVLVADDHRLFRAGLARMLSADPRFEVVGEAKDGAEAIDMALERKPDVVLMDLQMPRVTGVDAVKRLKTDAPEVRSVVVSAYAEGSMIAEAMANGATGYVSKDVELEEVAAKIMEVASVKKVKSLARHTTLSSRETFVLRQVAVGLSNKQIARRLGISEKTVRNHLSRVFGKLRATNRTEAVMNAIRVGIQVF
ncbi:MAG TPA: response regulator transcription factor [Candidatus Dormibacteraeota bacterium]|nr:response regulator transcription factor [Candidatus Dormibacteraeota bacterium]